MVGIPWEKTVEWVGIVSGCIIKKDGRYLLVQEKQKKVYGLWNIPAGYVDKGETIEQAALREVKEEAGYQVEIEQKIGVYQVKTKEPVKHIFKAHIISGQLRIQPEEILDAKWFTYKEIKKLNENGKFRSSAVFDALGKVEKL